ncbi:response regulator transcription factor [Amycolatopsis sp. cg5]|uniref:response regulator transcription factor n=1 Tax=Amycolatopsis sp. cg5 TaxID=3238802 RepID=UPI0035241AA8
MVRILVSESDPVESLRTVHALRGRGFDVCAAADAPSAVVKAPMADLVVLDISTVDGFELWRRIRAKSRAPIIGTTRRDADRDRVLGLCEEADSCLVKPYPDSEFLARVDEVLRAGRTAAAKLERGPLVIDPLAREVYVDGRLVVLTRKEFDLIRLLASEPERVFTRREIMYFVWGDAWAQSNRTIDTHVNSLRKKLRRRSLVLTVHGVGLRLGQLDEAQAAS